MSEFRVNTLSDAAGTGPVTLTKQSAAKAWVNFNGTGTVAIRDSLNVSGLTDNGVGIYEVAFTNGMANASYAVTVTVKSPLANRNTVASLGGSSEADPSTTAFQFTSFGATNVSMSDAPIDTASVNGDLA